MDGASSQPPIRHSLFGCLASVYSATSDPKNPQIAPKRETTPPFLNFASLQNAIDALQRAADDYEKFVQRAHENGGAALARASLADVNARLLQAERAMTSSYLRLSETSVAIAENSATNGTV